MSRFAAASLALKIVAAVGALLLTVMQGARLAFTNLDATAIGWLSILVGMIIGMSAALVAILDKDASTELGIAFRAQEDFKRLSAELAQADSISNDLVRANNLFLATRKLARAVAHSNGEPIADLAKGMLAITSTELAIAADFSIGCEFTLCIYQAMKTNGEWRLHLVADHREIPCDHSKARVWRPGNGAAFEAFLLKQERIYPDLPTRARDSHFVADPNLRRDIDDQRYKSLVAVPILGKPDAEAWGVVTATSNILQHFSTEQSTVARAEAARALAQMIGLAVNKPKRRVATSKKTSVASKFSPTLDGSIAT